MTPEERIAQRRTELLSAGGQSVAGGGVEKRRQELLAAGGRSESTPSPNVGAGVAAARGAASGATAGFADEAIGWLESTFPRLSLEPGEFFDPTVPTPAPRTYQQARDDYRGVQRETREAQPAAYIAGEVGGSIAGAKGLGAAGQGYRGAVALGAASGLGNSEAELAQPTVSGVGTATADTLKGAAFGVAGQFVGEQAGRVVPALARRLVKPTEDFAAMRALNAAGYFKNELKPIIRDGGKERAVRMGQALLDEPGVIQPGQGVETVLEGVQGARSEWGAEMGRILQQADSTGTPFDMSRVARRVIDEVIEPNLGDPAIEREVGAVGQLLRRYLQKAQQEGGLSFSEANRLKSTLDGKMNWGNRWNNFGPSEHLEKYQKQLAGIFRDEIDTQLGGALDEGAMASFKDAKYRVGTFKDAEGKARNLNAALEGNDQVRAKDVAAGMLAGGGPQGLLAIAASKAGRERGASVLARGADNLATSLDELARTSPETLGKYAGVVTSALARGPEALRAVEKVLNDTDPEWRAMRQRQTTQRE